MSGDHQHPQNQHTLQLLEGNGSLSSNPREQRRAVLWRRRMKLEFEAQGLFVRTATLVQEWQLLHGKKAALGDEVYNLLARVCLQRFFRVILALTGERSPRGRTTLTEERQQHNINDVQRLFFELFGRVRYNLLDGERVVRDLLEWHDLWYSVLPTRFPHAFNRQDDKQYHPYTELSMLRHTRWDSWPADALFIWTNDQALPHLRQRIEERWEASEIEIISPEADEEMRFSHLDDEHDRVLFVWWD